MDETKATLFAVMLFFSLQKKLTLKNLALNAPSEIIYPHFAVLVARASKIP